MDNQRGRPFRLAEASSFPIRMQDKTYQTLRISTPHSSWCMSLLEHEDNSVRKQGLQLRQYVQDTLGEVSGTKFICCQDIVPMNVDDRISLSHFQEIEMAADRRCNPNISCLSSFYNKIHPETSDKTFGSIIETTNMYIYDQTAHQNPPITRSLGSTLIPITFAILYMETRKIV